MKKLLFPAVSSVSIISDACAMNNTYVWITGIYGGASRHSYGATASLNGHTNDTTHFESYFSKPTNNSWDKSLYINQLTENDPKRDGPDFTEKELSIASAMLQGCFQQENSYLERLESIFSTERSLNILRTILDC